MRKIIEGYGVGVCLQDYGPAPLAAALRRLAWDAAWRAGFAAALRRAAADLCWEAEEERYLRLYPDAEAPGRRGRIEDSGTFK
jgi:glycosyltransferase involved in cell wall biosynthesis